MKYQHLCSKYLSPHLHLSPCPSPRPEVFWMAISSSEVAVVPVDPVPSSGSVLGLNSVFLLKGGAP